MNDFTREELEHLVTLFKATELGYPDFKLNENLWIKIEDMIDNYKEPCKHSYYLQGCGESAYAQCHKCGQVSKVEAK